MSNTSIVPFWKKIIDKEGQKEYFQKLNKFLYSQTAKYYPEPKDIYRAFELTPFEEAKVIIIGQDPYHDGNADGLSFSCKKRIAPSLEKILTALNISTSVNGGMNQSLQLDSWANQGVLLLNIVLTVEEAKPHSHAGKGWEKFTSKVVSLLLKRRTPKVFLLWGKVAQEWFNETYEETKKEVETPTLFDNEIISISDNNLIITAEHPAYAARQNRKWNSEDCFTKANQYLVQHKQTPIDWRSINPD